MFILQMEAIISFETVRNNILDYMAEYIYTNIQKFSKEPVDKVPLNKSGAAAVDIRHSFCLLCAKNWITQSHEKHKSTMFGDKI